MADNSQHDGYGNFRDSSGRDYMTSDNKPPSGGQTVYIPNGYGGTTEGTWNGGYVTPNK
jgi:hypothetical protein